MKMERFVDGMTAAIELLTKELTAWRENAKRVEISSYNHFFSRNFHVNIEFKDNEEYKILDDVE